MAAAVTWRGFAITLILYQIATVCAVGLVFVYRALPPD